jgi:hypothetical protein
LPTSTPLGLHNLPLAFELNQGQADDEVKFLARAPGYDLFLTSNEAVLSLVQPGTAEGEESSTSVVRMQMVGAEAMPTLFGMDMLEGKSNYFIGTDSSQWFTDVANYGQVKYEGIYPGIDLVYHGNPTQLQYDFLVAAGADPGQIALHFEGADGLSLDGSGNLVIQSGPAEVIAHAPILYQDIGGVRHLVDGGYTLLGGNQVGFSIGAYDDTHPLVIDPTLTYSTYLGGAGNDQGLGIATDSAGNVYLTGLTASNPYPGITGTIIGATNANPIVITSVNHGLATGATVVISGVVGNTAANGTRTITVIDANRFSLNGIAGNGNYTSGGTWRTGSQTAFAGSNDVFVTKLNAAGTGKLYSTYIGGNQNDQGFNIAVDGSGNAYVTGVTFGNFPIVGASNDTSFGGTVGSQRDVFLARLSSTGQVNYTTYFGGSSDEFAGANIFGGKMLALDGTQVIVAGSTNSNNLPVPNGFDTAFADTAGGTSYDGFVAKFNLGLAAGSQLTYASYLGGTGHDQASGVAVGPGGTIYAAGFTASTAYPVTASRFQGTNAGGNDVFVTKINPAVSGAGSLLASTYLGGTGSDQGIAIAVDAGGSAYVTGVTASTNFPTQSPIQAANGGGNDVFVTKLNSSLTGLIYSTYLGGAGNEQAASIALDNTGSVHLAGLTASSNFPTANPVQASLANFATVANDAFVTRLNPAGSSLYYSTYLGGSGADSAAGIAVDNAGNAYVMGFTASTNFLTANPQQATNAGSNDTFVAKLTDTGNHAPVLPVIGTQAVNKGTTLTIALAATDPDGEAVALSIDSGPAGLQRVSYAATVQEDSPLVYYRFEDANGASGQLATDSSGNAKHGTYDNDVSLASDGFGPGLGKAANFDNGATNDTVAVPALGTHSAVSVEAWINPRSLSFDHIYGTDGWPTGGLHWLVLGGAANTLFAINGGGVTDSTGLSIPLNRWSHIVSTYDSTLPTNNVKYYLNGALVATATINQQAAVLAEAHLGAWLSGSLQRQFDGLIDEFAIYGSALSAARIHAHYSAASGIFTWTPPPTDVSAWWRGEGDAVDVTGLHDGTLTNGATVTSGKVGQAFSFDGSDGYVDAPDSPTLTLGSDFTIEMWVNFDAVRSRSPFIGHDEGGGNAKKWIFWHDAVGHDTQLDVPALRLHVNDPEVGGGDVIVAPWNPQTGQWYHVALTRDGSTYALYIDGNQVATAVDAAMIPDPAASLTIGRAEGFFHDGLIDEPAFYNRALSVDEIQSIYASDSDGKGSVDGYGTTVTVRATDNVTLGDSATGWWQAEGNANDSADGNHGTLNGATFATGTVGQAFSFDGVDDYVNVPDSANLEVTTQFTLEAWIKPDDVSTWRQIISKFGAAGHYAYQYGLAPNGALRVDISAGGNTYDDLTSPTGLLSPGTWAHVAVTFQSGFLRLYVNGVQVASKLSSMTSIF